MADPIESTLDGVLKSFSVILTQSGPGSATLKLLSANPPRTITSIVETVATTVVQQFPIDLSWMQKDVRFTTPGTTTDPFGGLPITSLAGVGIAAITNGALTPPGISGLLNGLQGTIPIPVLTNVANVLNVSLAVRWTVRDEDGQPVKNVTYTLGAGGAGLSGSGADIVPPTGHEMDDLSLVFTSLIAELTSSLKLTQTITIGASICLSATDGATGALRASTGWVDLPPVTLVLPVIPVPTIAVFFTDELSGFCVVAVPANSPLDENAVQPALSTLNTVLSSLGGAAAIGGFFLSGLGNLVSAIQTANSITFVKADATSDLSDVQTQSASFWDWNGENANDEITTIALIGAPGRQLQCFNDSDYDTDEGKFTLTTDLDLLAQIDILTDNPVSQPASAVSVQHKPDGWNGLRVHSITSFNDELTSYRFGWS